MDHESLDKKNRVELVRLAKEYDIRGRTTMRKHELVEALLKAESSPPEPKKPAKPAKRSKKPSRAVEKMDAVAPQNSVSPMEADAVTSMMPDFHGHVELPPPDMPRGYGDTICSMMVRDPFWVFAYWEIQADRYEAARAELGEAYDSARLTMRVYDITDIVFDGTNAHSSFDIELAGGADNWYIEVPEDDRNYCADIGLRAADGRFFVLVRSNPVQMPRSGVSENVDEEWMARERDFERLYAISGGAGHVTGSMELRELMEHRLHGLVSSFGVSSFGGSGRN